MNKNHFDSYETKTLNEMREEYKEAPILNWYNVPIIITFLILHFHNEIILTCSDIKYTSGKVKRIESDEKLLDIWVTYIIEGEEYYRRYRLSNQDIDTIRVGQKMDCIFYSVQWPSFSCFDWYLYNNPSKEKEIKELRVVDKSFEYSKEATSPTGGFAP